MGKHGNISGQRFGRLTVISEHHKITGRSQQIYCRCLCDCGNAKDIYKGNLVRGLTQSCGCLHNEITSGVGKQRRTHGKTPKRLYGIWSNMIQRCENRRDHSFANYGERNITVCDEWRNSYEQFRDWALCNGYASNLSIDRIENDGIYTPDNCRWATAKVQANNRRNNRYLSLNGRTQTLQQWADEMDILYSTIHTRLRRGWSVERALTNQLFR